MRLTMMLLIVACLYAGTNSMAQTVNFSGKNIPLEKIFTEVKKQTGWVFIYTESLLNGTKPVSVKAENVKLERFLDMVLEGQGLKYTILNKTVLLSGKDGEKDMGGAPIRGKVLDSVGRPLSGATVALKNKILGVTDAEGMFNVNVTEGDVLTVTFVGYEPRQIIVTVSLLSSTNNLIITLKPSITKLEDVEVFSTGYQNIPKERATGSFVQIDNTLLNRSVSTNILDRLDGVTSGLIFNKNLQGGGRNESEISIRGRSTIFSNPNPLIVLDNFPYYGNLENINPNDVQDITILKDAAAASIWGAYSGNGVIVITTKKGKYGEKMKVSLNSNITLGNKPNLFYSKQMSISDYIDLERYLFESGAYNSTINNSSKPYLSPVVEVLLKRRNLQITNQEADLLIAAMKMRDVRKDIEDYVYQQQLNQQYAINISGGDSRYKYNLSTGFDRNLKAIKFNSYQRFTFNFNNTYDVIKNKLEVSAGVLFTSSTSSNANASYYRVLYDQLVDNSGKPLSIGGSIRQSYIDTAGGGKLLDWNYRPLDELRLADNKSTITDYRINTNVTYKVIKSLDISLAYQYNKGLTENTENYNSTTYQVRSLVNSFTQIDQNTGMLRQIIPIGYILNSSTSTYWSHNVRGQFNFSKNIDNNNYVTLLGGAEIRKITTESIFRDPLYGFDPNIGTDITVDFLTEYPLYYNSLATARIPNDFIGKHRKTDVDNNISYFANLAYTFQNKYTLTFSGRKDQSNIFGVATNQKGVPLWSVGVSWDISREDFYSIPWMQYLKVRLTDGYNGNVNKSLSAYTTAAAFGNNIFNFPSIYIQNPPNSELRWERINVINAGIDFSILKNRITGSVEYYVKKGSDLLGDAPYDPTSGFSQFRGNVSDMKGSGFDITLKSVNIDKLFKWYSNILISGAKDKVTNYKVKQSTVSSYLGNTYSVPLEGFPLYAIFAYPYAGLDFQGNPMGYLAGNISQDYTAITGSSDLTSLKYIGPSNPTIFGSFRNTFSYKPLELSFNITYKLGYYFRRNSLNYSSLLQASGAPQASSPDWSIRWKNQGDELSTNVPSLIYPHNSNRSALYNNSDVLVERGDHIRLQDIQFAYTLRKGIEKLRIKTIRFYLYANNILLIWKANNHNIDPDFVPGNNLSYPSPRRYSFGLNVDF